MKVKENGQKKKGRALNKEDDQNVQDFRVELDNFLVQQKKGYANSTNRDSTVSPSVSTTGQNFTNANDLPTNPLMADLEDTDIFSGTYNDEDVGAEADLNNLETTMNVSLIPTTRIHKDHPKDQIIGDINSATQTRRMTKISEEHAMKVTQALTDPSWIEAMQYELLQFRLQKVWRLVDLPKGKHAIGTKWVYRNKKDERGVVVRNKARLVAQGYTQEEGIDYDEVFAPVARIEAIRLFLAYASFMGLIVYQMDVKSVFLYGTIEEEVYVCQPPSFEDPQFPDKVYKKEDRIFINQDKYVADILKNFDFTTVKATSTPIETNKALNKDEEAEDVDVHLYRLTIRSLMYLTASKPNIMFSICACARFQVTPKTSHLYAVKRIFRYLKGQPKLGLWYLRDSPFDLEAFSDSDYAGSSFDRKSTIGGCQFLGKRLISWHVNKSNTIVDKTLLLKQSMLLLLIVVDRENAVENVGHLVGQNPVQNQGTKNVGNHNGLSVVSKIANQYGNGNVETAPAEGNGNGINGACEETERANANCTLENNLQQASTSGTLSDKAPVYDSDGSAENDSNVISEVSNVEQGGGTVEQHLATVEETRAYQESLFHNLVAKVKKVNSVNHKLRETNAKLTTKLAGYKNQEKSKFVRDFKSLTKEAGKSIVKQKALELEIEHFLREVVSRDIMSIVQNPSAVDTSNLQTDLKQMVKKCKYDKNLNDQAYNNMQQKIERLQAQLGYQKGKSTSVNTRFLSKSILGTTFFPLRPKLLSVTPFPKSTVIPKVRHHHGERCREQPRPKGAYGCFHSQGVFDLMKHQDLGAFGFRTDLGSLVVIKQIRNSQEESYGSNDMAHNNYLEEARKKTQERNRNSKPSMMPSARLQNTANGSTPNPKRTNQTSRSLPTSKSSCVTITVVPKAYHSRNSSSFSDSKHFFCSTCHKCVFNANHDACITKLLNEVNSRHRFSPKKTSAVYEKTSPRSCLRWKPTSKIFTTVGLKWIPTGKLFDSCTSKFDSEPPNGSNDDITNPYECDQTLNVRLVPQPPSPTHNVPPTKNDWDTLFCPMLDEYFNPSPSVAQPVLVAAVQEHVVSTGTPSSTRIDQDTL
ncbi:retrovirus-related pol polyprotein from transposon TNT 1-94 [Tanacetum coccineum]